MNMQNMIIKAFDSNGDRFLSTTAFFYLDTDDYASEGYAYFTMKVLQYLKCNS